MATTKIQRSVGSDVVVSAAVLAYGLTVGDKITVRADPGDTNVVLSTVYRGPGTTVLTPENARRLAEALIRAAAVIEGTLECSYCRDRMGLDDVGEDDPLHRPANQCKGCAAPLDHHEFRIV